MQPIFTMQYGEFAVADYLSKKIKNVSVFIPASAQEKGIDLLLYRYDHNCNKANTIQVKMSRTYYNDKEDSGFPFYLWFNRFPVQQNANWYILVGIYAKHSDDIQNAGANSTKWDTIMLAFTNKERIMHKKLTAYLSTLEADGFGKWIVDTESRGTVDNPIQKSCKYYLQNRECAA